MKEDKIGMNPQEKNQKNITDYLLQRGDWMCAYKPHISCLFHSGTW